MKALIFDTETSGLIINHTLTLDKQPSVIEYFGHTVDLATGEITDELNIMIKPAEYPMTAKTIKDTKTRLSNEMLAECFLFSYHAKVIREQIESAPIVIAHNASFDKEMIDIEYERLKEPPLKWPRARICTVEQTCHLLSRRLSLTDLHGLLFGEGFPEAHRAKADVEALTRCAVEMFKRGLL